VHLIFQNFNFLKMKNIFIVLALAISISASAQQTTTFSVSGNCGMCKSRIEKAAKEAGATEAKWDVDAQLLTVKVGAKSSVSAIQQKVAAVGHDNAGVKAPDAVYDKLHGCCKYDRNAATATSEKESCCKSGETCKKDEKKTCMPGCEKPCCKDGKCTKGGECTKESKTMNCCKDGKCSMPGHDGKDCCKKG
jgi:hypothetical protein